MPHEVITTVQKEAQGELVQFYVRNNDWGWGHIIIDPRNGMVLCYTDYGNYNFGWSHPGEDIFKFLPRLSFDYAMGKFLGRRKEINVEASVKNISRNILERRRDEYLTKDEAREMWNALAEAEREYGTSGEAFSHALAHSELPNHDQEWYDGLVYQHPEEAYGFWERIWKPLMEFIKAEAQPLAA